MKSLMDYSSVISLYKDFMERSIIEPSFNGLLSLIENLRVLMDWIYAQGRVSWNILQLRYNACTEKFRLIGNGDLYFLCDKIFLDNYPELERYTREELELNYARCREWYIHNGQILDFQNFEKLGIRFMPDGSIDLDSYQEYLHMTTVIQLHCAAVFTSSVSFQVSILSKTKDGNKFSFRTLEPAEIQKVLTDGIPEAGISAKLKETPKVFSWTEFNNKNTAGVFTKITNLTITENLNLEGWSIDKYFSEFNLGSLSSKSVDTRNRGYFEVEGLIAGKNLDLSFKKNYKNAPTLNQSYLGLT
jgi:hypothetical protein